MYYLKGLLPPLVLHTYIGTTYRQRSSSAVRIRMLSSEEELESSVANGHSSQPESRKVFKERLLS